MKLLNWNVNGMRAFIKKGKLDWILEQDADIITFQEIKGRPEQFPLDHELFERYTHHWNPAQRPGYSGVATISRVPFTGVVMGMGQPDYDNEGRIIQTSFDDITLLNIYFPNGQRDHSRVLYKIAFYDSLYKYLTNDLGGKNIILTGDFNTAHMEIDLANPEENRQTSGFLPEERQALDRYLSGGFVDIFRHLYPDTVKYTWWTYRFGARLRNIGWRIDYFLVSQDLIDRVDDLEIYDQIDGSDHCPLILNINI
ncbi:MAG: exodeoxyribonuclease III [Anaerolineae bacterium]|jgi:exodeoxyribonuclease-3|nr:exodeoxyribonuclease III [Anaerolineae bacterium]